MNKYPFILIFDIDNTVIGDVKLLHQEAQLLEYIYNTCKKEKIGKCKLIENINMQKELKTGMLRPNIKEFIKFCDSKFKNVEMNYLLAVANRFSFENYMFKIQNYILID